MTRAEAIELAVRRWWGLCGPISRHLAADLAFEGGVASRDKRSITAHFRAVCRAYDVRDEPSLQHPAPNSQIGACYDGHGHRI